MKKDIQSIYAKARLNTVATLESAEPMGNVVRVVLAFNKEPNASDIEKSVAKHFKDLQVVEGSFRMRNHSGSSKIVAGYLTHKDNIIDLKDKPDTLRAVAANVFMDDSDNSIWQVVGGSLVKTQNEELADLVAIANVQPQNRNAPIEALANVRDFAGAQNTQIVAYVSPNLAKVVAGVRVGDDHVYSSEEGLVEVTEDQVVDTEQLNGADVEDEVEAKRVCASASINDVVDYYTELYAHNPLFLEKVIETINGRAIA